MEERSFLPRDQIRTLASDRYVGDTVLRQLAAADLILLNKVDRVSDAEAQVVAAWLHGQAPHARIIRTVNARLPCEVALGPAPRADDREIRHRYRVAREGEDARATFSTETLRAPARYPSCDCARRSTASRYGVAREGLRSPRHGARRLAARSGGRTSLDSRPGARDGLGRRVRARADRCGCRDETRRFYRDRAPFRASAGHARTSSGRDCPRRRTSIA